MGRDDVIERTGLTDGQCRYQRRIAAATWTGTAVLACVMVAGAGRETTVQAQTGHAAGGNAAASGEAPAPAPGSWQVEAVSAANGAEAVVQAFEVSGDTQASTFRLRMSKGVTAEVYTLANPYRIVIDLPHVAFPPADRMASQPHGLVRAFRYGLFAESRSRIVIDAAGPVRVDRAEMIAVPKGAGIDLLVGLSPMDAKLFGAGTGAARQLAPTRPTIYDDGISAAKPREKPLVMIDPGHGGIDPGAIGPTNVLEKNVVLQVAKLLAEQLKASGQYDVQLTRHQDIFVSLNQRLKLSRDAGADLFLSLHADSIEANALSQTVRGASVYTLSERASDEQARLRAERENASDLLAGIDVGESDGSDDVMGILLDLMKRETAEFSLDLSRLLVSKLRDAVVLTRDPQRAAAFKVLKQSHAPAVLIELGYLSHAEDEKLMKRADWQKKVTTSLAASVDNYFARRTAKAR